MRIPRHQCTGSTSTVPINHPPMAAKSVSHPFSLSLSYFTSVSPPPPPCSPSLTPILKVHAIPILKGHDFRSSSKSVKGNNSHPSQTTCERSLPLPAANDDDDWLGGGSPPSRCPVSVGWLRKEPRRLLGTLRQRQLFMNIKQGRGRCGTRQRCDSGPIDLMAGTALTGVQRSPPLTPATNSPLGYTQIPQSSHTRR